MALKMWLTLQNQCNNRGLTYSPSNTSPTFANSVKFGEGGIMTGGNVSMDPATSDYILNNQEVTICFWVYVNAATGTNVGGLRLFGNDAMTGDNNNRKFSLFHYPTCNDLHMSWMNASSSTFFSNTVSGIMPSYQWTHIAVVYKNPNVKVYANGILKFENNNAVSNTPTFNLWTRIITGSSYHYLTDYRIYDNALSIAQIKDIARAMTLHIPMNDPFCTTAINKYSGETVNGKCSVNDSYTVTKLSGEVGYNYKLSYTGTGTTTWKSISFPHFAKTNGKTYDYSCKVRVHSKNFNIYLRAARVDNDWTTNSVNILNNTDGKWHEFHVRQTINQTFDRSGSTITSNPLMEFYSDGLTTSGTVYSVNFDIKDVQVSECDTDAPLSTGSFPSSVAYDLSGHFHNNDIVNKPAFRNDSPVNGGCYRINNGRILKGRAFPIGTNPAFTVNFWFRPTSSSYTQWADVIGWGTENAKGNMRMEVADTTGKYWGFFGGPIPDSGMDPGTITVNKWHMITFTSDSTTCRVYNNATQTSTLSITNSGYASYLHNGWHYVGDAGMYADISDLRVYCTCLSATDIYNLYHSAVCVSDSGALMTNGEYIEED